MNIISCNTIYSLLWEMVDQRESYDIHHIQGQCNKKHYNVGIKKNQILVNKQEHRALNTLMGHCQSPKEQLELLFTNWRLPILSKDVKDRIIDVLSIPDRNFYIDELYKGTKR